MNASMVSVSISPEEAFERLGRITRQLHEAMTELGLAQGLMEVACEIPDARDRLSHVGQMTETAANKVLNVIDVAQPQCRSFRIESESLITAIEQRRKQATSSFGEMSDLLATCQMFCYQANDFADAQHTFLGDIMITQDFQDLSGQVIKKVIDIISQTEQQLLALLMHSAPEHGASARPKTGLEGPQAPDKALRQTDVDDLLASLGF
jgi:chemotaxis protein CheZ